MKSISFLTVCAKASIASLLLAGSASANFVNLNDFYQDPTVTVSVDGYSAVIHEDSSLSSVLLSNNPSLGDPNVILPAAGLALVFNYSFAQPASNNQDEFGVFLVDANTGGSAGAAYESFIQMAGSGVKSFNLSGLVGSTIGLQFQLSALPGDAAFTSTVTISNVRLEPVPEPEEWAMLLVGSMLVGYQVRRKQKALNLT